MMGKGQVSIGDDTPTGEPENAPRGPYITDEEDDMSAPEGSQEDSDQRRSNRQPPSRTETEISKRSELGSDNAGR
jgi:hypothetical protein